MRVITKKQFNTKPDGIATLLVILWIGAFALGSALTMSLGTLSGVSKNINTISGDQKFFTAESGMGEGIYQYVKEIETTGASAYVPGDLELLNNVVSGNIEVTPLTWPYVLVRGSAENERGQRSVKKLVSVFPEGFAF